MKTNDYIKEYIDREKLIEPNPYLASRIMAKIENVDTAARTIPAVLRYVAVAASISIVVMMGIVIGDSYTTVNNQYAGININDSQIENFALFNSDDNE